MTNPRASVTARWVQLISVIICMIMIANLQYWWTLFVHPINKAHGGSIASIQFAFSIFIALETWLTPIQGWFADVLRPRRGPKLVAPIAVLVNPANRIVTEIQKSDVEEAARLGSISFSLKPGANATSM